jgi:N utilization substance protein B
MLHDVHSVTFYQKEMGRLTLTDLPDFNADNYDIEVVEHPEASTERSAARRIALQILYEVDCAHHPEGDVTTARLEEEQPITRKAEKYVRRLVQGVSENRIALDTFIQRYASEWPLEQVAIVDRNILRMAVFELASQTTTPVSVIIAEAIELANLFGAEGSTRFVNGVLGAMAANDEQQVRQLLATSSGE